MQRADPLEKTLMLGKIEGWKGVFFFIFVEVSLIYSVIYI